MPFYSRFFFFILWLNPLGLAQDNPDHWCRTGLFTVESEDFALGLVQSTEPQISFYKDDELEAVTCPSLENEDCLTGAYLLPNDVVVMSDKVYDNFVCSWFKPIGDYGTVSWLDMGQLELYPHTLNPEFGVWTGVWSLAENQLSITSSFLGEGIIIEGLALWLGLNENVHIGEVFGRVLPEGNYVRLFDDYGCELELWLLDDFLVARDNKQCGGVNVTFDGVYSK